MMKNPWTVPPWNSAPTESDEMTTTLTAAVAGASGYAGGEILRLLSGHPHVRIATVTAAASAGTRIGDHHPHLVSLADRILDPTDADHLAGHDIVFLALPHGQSAAVAAALGDDTLVIDCGADFRLEDAAEWQKYYGSTHAGTWTYGLPELLRDGGDARQRVRIPDVRRIAVPGCNVTAVTLALQPAAAAGLVDCNDVVAVLANGYSGAGKSTKPHLMAAEALGSAVAYGVGGTHRHIPEIHQNLRSAGGQNVAVNFIPTLVPMSRGILATVTAPLRDRQLRPDEVDAAYSRVYDQDEPFVHVLSDGQQPNTGATLGSNMALLQTAVDADAGRLVVTCAIDNLVKGTAGGAIQSMNLALGMDETTALNAAGVKP